MNKKRIVFREIGYDAPVLRMTQVAVAYSLMAASDGDIDDLEDGEDYGDGME